MQQSLRILILDDWLEVAERFLMESLRALGATFPEDQRATVMLGKERTFNISWEFEDDPLKAEGKLLDQRYIDGFQLILLDNNWDRRGMPDTYSLYLLEQMHKNGVEHSFLVIYTAVADSQPMYMQRALAAGARTLIDKDDHLELKNLLLDVAGTSQLSHSKHFIGSKMFHVPGKVAQPHLLFGN